MLMPWLHVKQNYFKIISAFVDVPAEIILPKIILKLFHEAYCSSCIFTDVFNVAEIILK